LMSYECLRLGVESSTSEQAQSASLPLFHCKPALAVEVDTAP